MALPLLFMAASSGLKALGSIGSGIQSARANKASALGAQIERDLAMLRRDQVKADSRANLQTALGNIDAVRSARGASLDSQTGQMIEMRTRQDAYREEGRAALGELQRAGSAEQARRGYASAARWAIPMSIIGASSDAAQAFSYGKDYFAKVRG